MIKKIKRKLPTGATSFGVIWGVEARIPLNMPIPADAPMMPAPTMLIKKMLKNTIFTSWTSEGDNMIKKIKRKLQEQYLAIELTKTLSKDEILVRYMNTINLGQNTLGVEAAAQRYFGGFPFQRS